MDAEEEAGGIPVGIREMLDTLFMQTLEAGGVLQVGHTWHDRAR